MNILDLTVNTQQFYSKSDAACVIAASDPFEYPHLVPKSTHASLRQNSALNTRQPNLQSEWPQEIQNLRDQDMTDKAHNSKNLIAIKIQKETDMTSCLFNNILTGANQS